MTSPTTKMNHQTFSVYSHTNSPAMASHGDLALPTIGEFIVADFFGGATGDDLAFELVHARRRNGRIRQRRGGWKLFELVSHRLLNDLFGNSSCDLIGFDHVVDGSGGDTIMALQNVNTDVSDGIPRDISGKETLDRHLVRGAEPCGSGTAVRPAW